MAADWKSRWPDLRTRYVSLLYKPLPPPPPPASGSRPAPSVGSAIGTKSAAASTAAASADYWFAMAGAGSMGTNFINKPLDKLTPDWNGEYEDGFGGQVSTRGTGEGVTGELIGRIPAKDLIKEKNGDVTATYTHRDTELKPEDQKAIVKFRKTGHFLFIETQYTERYHGRAWFNGIYRWGPVPKE